MEAMEATFHAYKDSIPNGHSRVLKYSLDAKSPEESYHHEQAIDYVLGDQMQAIRELNVVTEQGQKLLCDMYSIRSCQEVIPQLDNELDDATTHKYYKLVIEVLKPRIELIKSLHQLSIKAASLLIKTMQSTMICSQKLSKDNSSAISSLLLESMIKAINAITQLSHVKSVKSESESEIRLYKRAVKFQSKGKGVESTLGADFGDIERFASSHSTIWSYVKDQLSTFDHVEVILTSMLNFCLKQLEQDTLAASIDPKANLRYIHVLPYISAMLLHIHDSVNQHRPPNDAHKSNSRAMSDKKIVDNGIKLLMKYPVIPVFMDMNIRPWDLFQSLLLSDSSKQTDLFTTSIFQVVTPVMKGSSYDIVATTLRLRPIMREYQIRFYQFVNHTHEIGKESLGMDDCLKLMLLIKEGLSILTEWKMSLVLFFSYLYQQKAQMTTEDGKADLSSMITNEEWETVLITVCELKNLTSYFQSKRLVLIPSIRKYIYHHLQTFVQQTLLPILHRAEKKQVASAQLLHQLRLLCGDWKDPNFVVDDFTKARKRRVFPEILDRSASPSICQLEMIQMLIDAVIRQTPAKSNSFFKSFSTEQLTTADLEPLLSFGREVTSFSHLLQFDQCVQSLGDCSMLWFRESLDQSTKSRTSRYSLVHSIPWNLLSVHRKTNHFQDPIAVFSIYLDALHQSLEVFQVKYLADEVQAEADFALRHTLSELVEDIYYWYKVECGKKSLDSNGSLLSSLTRVLNASEQSNREKNIQGHTMSVQPPSLERLKKMITKLTFGPFHDKSYIPDKVAEYFMHKLHTDMTAWLKKTASSDSTYFVAAIKQRKVISQTLSAIERGLPMLNFDSFYTMYNRFLADHKLSQDTSPNDSVWYDKTTYIKTIVVQSLLTDLFPNFAIEWKHKRYLLRTLPGQIGKFPINHRRMSTMRKRMAMNRGIEGINEGCLRNQWRKVGEYINKSGRGDFRLDHIASILELLSPSDIEALVKDCTCYITTKIQQDLAQSLPSIAFSIKAFQVPTIKSQYQDFLKMQETYQDVFKSTELRTHVLQTLRELGNTLTFLFLLHDLMESQILLYDSFLPTCASDLVPEALSTIQSVLENSSLSSFNSSHTILFGQLWAVLEFVITNDSKISLYYGDGVYVAGLTLVHLFNEKSTFELSSLNDQMIQLNELLHLKSSDQPEAKSGELTKRLSWLSKLNVKDELKDANERTALDAFVEKAMATRSLASQLTHRLARMIPFQDQQDSKTFGFEPRFLQNE